MRAVTGAKPAIVITLLAQWDASQMGTNADHNEPFSFLNARFVGFRVL